MVDWPVQTPPTFEAALNDLEKSENIEVKRRAIETLSSVTGDDLVARAQAALHKALGSTSPAIRADASLALAEIGPAPALEKLSELVADQDGRVAQAAVIALGESGNESTLPVLTKALSSEDADVRFQAVLAIARTAGREAVELLETTLHDEDPEVRSNIAAAFADLQVPPESVPLLERLLQDGHLMVRLEAALALSRRGDPRATPTLIEALNNPDVAPQAVHALGLLSDPSAVEPLRKVCKGWTTHPTLRAAAAASLAALGDTEGLRELHKWLVARRREPRAMAIHASGELRIRGVVQQLCDILGNPRATERDAAARSLGQIGDPDALNTLRAADSDPDPDVSGEVREAIALLEKNLAE